MEFINANYTLIVILICIYYLCVVVSLVHLIFKTHYDLTNRLLWMVVLWVVPLFGPLAYWISWKKQRV